jgi:hypothetical protein
MSRADFWDRPLPITVITKGSYDLEADTFEPL